MATKKPYVHKERNNLRGQLQTKISSKFGSSQLKTRLLGRMVIPGKGKKGKYCGVNKATDFDFNGAGVKYFHLTCKERECPNCWSWFITESTFKWVSRLLTYSIDTKQPIYPFVASPKDTLAKERNWEQLNRQLYHRGYRHAKQSGMEGGVVFTHAYRLKADCIKELKSRGYNKSGGGGFWSGVRNDVLDLGSWACYVKIGYHLHGFGFGEPKKHSCKDYFFGYKEERKGVPKKLKLDELVKMVSYVLTHLSVPEGKEAIRRFGSMYHYDYESSPNWDLACQETVLMMNTLERERAKKRRVELKKELSFEDGKLRYVPIEEPDEPPEEEDDFDWMPIYEFYSFWNNEDWRAGLSDTQEVFWSEFRSRLDVKDGEGKPVPVVYGDIHHPSDVVAVVIGTDTDNEDITDEVVQRMRDNIEELRS